MKKVLLTALLLSSSISFAASTTDMSTKWICTTNASSSDVATDKNADDQMAKKSDSAANAFAFAAKNCRDCTKVTCEVQD